MSPESSGAYDQRLLPAALEDRLVGWFGRTSGIALLAVTAALWTTLITWSVTDPSLTHATGGSAKNALGVPGAVISDLMLQTLGLGAVLAILAPMLWALELIAAERIRGFRHKATFYPLSILVFSGALSALPVAATWPLNHGYGGILGDMIYGLGSGLFGVVNAERGGLAAGLVLFASGFATLFASIGIELKDLAEAMAELRKPKAEAAVERGRSSAPHFNSYAFEQSGGSNPIAFGQVASSRSKSWFAAKFGFQATADVTTAGPQLNGEAPRLPEHHSAGTYPPNWSQDWQSPSPVHGYPHAPHGYAHDGGGYPMQSHPAYPQGYPQSGVPQGGYPHRHDVDQGYPEAGIAPSRHAHYDAAPTFADPRSIGDARIALATGTPAPRHPPVAVHDADGRREPSFDARTDAASRAIAERFAPGAAATHVSPAQHAPPSPGAKKLGPGLLGGISFRRAEPAYKRPSLNLLKRPTPQKPGADFTPAMQRGTARLLEDVLGDFGVKGEIKDIKPGPVVTLFEFEPARGTKSSRVIGLSDDIARSMSATSVRAAIVPGRNAIGIELPNARRETVLLREILETETYRSSDATLPITLGKSIGGEPVVADLARMPHLLVAGTTGSGKSVGVNTMILSLLFRHAPDECRFLMIDPKMLELSVYNGIPHLITPVVTDPIKAIAALNWAVREMEERYKRMSQLSVRNIEVFNNRVRNAKKRGELMSRSVQTGFDKKTGQAVYESETLALEPLPYIVIVVDEFADLMVVAGKEIEAAVQRLAQMARAAGIHLVMATQRPSVDIVTGTIKANFPTRISFKVASKIDSRTILNDQGAEQLLGQGDMLFSASSGGQPIRVHGAYVADEEVEAIVSFLKSQGAPRYVDGVTDGPAPIEARDTDGEATSADDLYDRAVAVVLRDGKASTSYVQRRLSIGYNRAADLIERMEREGLISPANAVGKRDVLAGRDGSSSNAA